MAFLRIILVRCLVAVATLLAVSALIFFGMEALPGDAASASLGSQSADQHLLAAKRHELQLDKPVLTRYGDWLGGFVRGDLGVSSSGGGATVSSLLSGRLDNSVALMLATMLCLVPLAVLLGTLSALKRDTFVDHAISLTSLAFISTPEFVVGAILIVLFATVLGALPAVSLVDPAVSVWSQLKLLVLPVATLVLVYSAQATRMVRGVTIDILRSDYVRTAVLRGAPRRVVVGRHVLPNAFGATLQVIAIMTAYLAGGMVVTEVVFQYPGMGSALAQAVQNRDLPTVEAIAMIVCGFFVVANLAADLLVIAMNPKLRRGR